MADDLDELTSLGNVQPVAKARGRPRRGARQQQQQQQQQLVLADAEPEVQDLVELAAIAAAPPRRHEEQRSWQHAEQAGKTAKRLAAKAADADAKRRRSVRGDPLNRGFDLSLGGHSSRPYCQVGPDGRSTEFGYLKIGCGTRFARCSLEVSGKFASSSGWVVVARHREIATVRDAASCRPSTPVEDEPLDSEINRTSRVARLAWQWDETSQRVLGVQRNKYRRERESTAHAVRTKS